MAASNRDPYRLERFVVAQHEAYAAALAEMRAGQKRSHWMWFVFPQILGLGSSENARVYAISGSAEAEAYLAHAGKSAHEIFGSPDDVKLKSSMTLYASTSATGSVFERVLATFFGGDKDPETLRRRERIPPTSSDVLADQSVQAKGVGERSRSIGPCRPTRRDFCRPRAGAPCTLDAL